MFVVCCVNEKVIFKWVDLSFVVDEEIKEKVFVNVSISKLMIDVEFGGDERKGRDVLFGKKLENDKNVKEKVIESF